MNEKVELSNKLRALVDKPLTSETEVIFIFILTKIRRIESQFNILNILRKTLIY
jgi:hypothetical protein